MKVHFLSQGYAVPLAYRLLLNGHECTGALRGVKYGKGFLERGDAEDADVIICDGFGSGEEADRLAADGHSVLFGGRFAELMNARPEFQKRFMVDNGFGEPVPVEDPAQSNFVLLWYDGTRAELLAQGVLHLDADRDTITSGVACELEPVRNREPNIELANLLGKAVFDVGYRGLISVGTHEDGRLTGLHFGVRPIIMETLCEYLPGGLERLLEWGAPGLTPTDCAIGLVLWLPPWPHAKPSLAGKGPVPFFIQDERHFWPLDVNLTDDGLEYAGRLGVVGTVTARGRPDRNGSDRSWWPEANWRALRTASGLNLAGLEYRKDIGLEKPCESILS